MTRFDPNDRLEAVNLIEERVRARTPEIQQELDVAIYDLKEENRFRPIPREGQPAPVGPYRLNIGMVDRMLLIDVRSHANEPAIELRLSLSPLRGIIKDYFAICEQYFDAVKRLPPSKIEAIDMGRRGLHNEGAQILRDRLEGRIETDEETARRIFTVICALQFRG